MANNCFKSSGSSIYERLGVFTHLAIILKKHLE